MQAPRAPEGPWNARKDVAPCFREGRIKAYSTPVDQGLAREPCGTHTAVRDARILPGLPRTPGKTQPLSCGNPARQGLPCTTCKA